MEELRKFEGELKVKSSLLSNLRIDVSSAESFSRLKGTAHLYVGGRITTHLSIPILTPFCLSSSHSSA